MKNFSACFYLIALLSFGGASYGAPPGEAPRTVACNEGETGALAETNQWVLAKSDTQDDGSDHYKVLGLSAWASAGNSAYCMRWELENQSLKNPPTATGTAPTLKNVFWKDIDLYQDRLEPGGSKRAVKWTKRDYSSTPIDRNTDVTGATDATFKLKAFLPRVAEASAKQSEAPQVEKISLAGRRAGQDKFGDIITGYSQGTNSVLITSGAEFDGKEVIFAISVNTPHGAQFKSTKFPFALAMLKADFADGFSSPSVYATIDVPLSHKTQIPLDQLEDKSIYIVKQPLFIYSESNYTCFLASVYSPIKQSFGQSSCK